MGSRFPSHQLGNGLYVSGRPEQPKERTPCVTSVAMPYTGGDIKKSGDLGKMFDIQVDKSKMKRSGPIPNAPSRTGSFGPTQQSGHVTQNTASRAHSTSGPVNPGSVQSLAGAPNRTKSNSGPLNKHGEVMKSSGPQPGANPVARQNSGSIAPVLPATGLITSGPVSSGPLNSSGAPRKVSGQLDSASSLKLHNISFAHNQAVTKLNSNDEYSFYKNFPRGIYWAVILLFVMGLISGGFILGAVRNAILLIVVVALFAIVVTLYAWNSSLGRKAVTDFIQQYPDAELRTAKDGQFVKISGVVTCGSVPLESSFQKIPRCVYTSANLYEYRGWNSKAASATHRCFTWGLRSSERYMVDFYISDFQSGLRALVKTGHGAKVAPYVEESIAVDINDRNQDLSPEFVRWLGERNLSSDGRVMRLKEGYIKEGSTVSVLGVVQRTDNVLMIVPPSEPFVTGCQWTKCFLPAAIEGIILRCEETSDIDVIPV